MQNGTLLSGDFLFQALNSLPYHIAIVDKNGEIQFINNAWNQFAKKNAADFSKVSAGNNYFTVCQNATDDDHSREAISAYNGIQQVLLGKLENFGMEYSCHSPSEERWFKMMCTLLFGSTSMAVISHIDITQEKHVERELKKRESELQALKRINNRVNANLSLETVIRTILEEISKELNPDFSFFYLREGTSLILKQVYPEGALLKNFSDVSHRVETCLCGIAASSREPIYSFDIANDPRYTLDECKQVGIHSFASIPLNYQAEVIGCLGLASTTPCNYEKKHQFIEAVALEVATSLYNAILYERMDSYAQKAQREIVIRKKIENSLEESRNQYRSVIETILDGIIIVNSAGIIQFVNPAFCILHQYSEAELIGSKAISLIHPDSHEQFRLFTEEIRDKGYFQGNGINVKKDGSSFHIDVQGSALHYKGQDCYLAAIRDISKRIKAEQALKQSEKLYYNLFNKNSSMIMLIDPKSGKIFDANPSACKFYGYPRKTLRSMQITDINVLSKDEIKKEMEKAQNEMRNYFNFRHRLANNITRDVEVFSGPIKVGRKTLLCSIIHDITDRTKYTSEREKLVQKLQKALDEVKTLRGILPICSYCKKIRDDTGYWDQLESYINKHSGAEFSHSICPECVKSKFPDISDEILKRQQ